MSQDQVQLVALVKLTAEDGRAYGNGAVFTTSKEQADYFKMSGYARTPTADEAAAAARLPQPKRRPEPTTTRQEVAVEQEGERKDQQEDGRPKVGRHLRRDQRATR